MDRQAVNHVVETLNEPGADGIDVPGFADALDRVGVEDLQKHTFGERAVALLVLERELNLQVSGRTADLDAFADALTAFVVACNRGSAEIAGRQRIVQVVREFLARRRLPREVLLSISPHALTDAKKRDWEHLARRVPWIRWMAHHKWDPPVGVTVSPPELVDLLVLLRPRQARRYEADGVTSGPVPPRFAQLYPVNDWHLAPAILDELADALSPLLYKPARTAQMVQALTLPAALALAVKARVGEELHHVALAEHLLAVRVDDHESERVLFVNLSHQYALQMHVDDELVTLPPNAVEQRGAFDYCSAPARITTSTRVQLGGRQVSLDTPLVPLAEDTNVTTSTLPLDLFRGREEQLARLKGAMSGRGPRSGNLIFGTRRAGKSTLMEHASQDGLLRGAISIDVSNTATSVRDYAAWSRDVSKRLATQVRRQLPGVTVDVPTGDFVDALIDLDDALDGGPPVAVALDELDVLLLPEQGSGGRRAAGRLGNLVFRNLVVMGTVQRFHRTVHEFKNWQMIECPADLAWADGVSYFLGPLADVAPGPRVEWLTRAGVTPQLFVSEIEPFIGLRPYFWGQLRSNFETVVGGDSPRSRLISPDVLREKLAELVTQDAHLNIVMDDGAYVEPEERRRRDLFSVEERRILVRFALMRATGSALAVSDARDVGGEAAIKELIDRAYLTFNESGTKLRTAVPIYHEFLRSRVTDLQAVTPDAASLAVPIPRLPSRPDDRPVVVQVPTTKPQPVARPAVQRQPEQRPAVRTPVAKAAVVPPVLPPQVSQADLERARIALREALLRVDQVTIAKARWVIKDVTPVIFSSTWAGRGTFAGFLETYLPEFQLVEGPAGGYVRSAVRRSPEAAVAKTPVLRGPIVPPACAATNPPLTSPVVPEAAQPLATGLRAGISRARLALITALQVTNPLPLTTVGEVIKEAAPEIFETKWAGAGRLTAFLARFLPEFPHMEGVGGGYLTSGPAVAANAPAAKAVREKVGPDPSVSLAKAALNAKAVSAKVTPVAEVAAGKAPIAKTPVAKTPVAKAPVAKTPVAKAPITKIPTAHVPVPQQQHPGVTEAELKRARAALHKALATTDSLPLGMAGQVIMQAAPRIFATQWAGTGKLTNFLEEFLPEFSLEDGPSDRVVRPPRIQRAGTGGILRRFLRKIVSDSPPS